MAISSLAIDEIVVGDRLRPLDRSTVDRLKESILRLGEIKVPISVRFLSLDEGWELVAGLHRLQAATEMGMKEVPVREEKGGEIDARLWEIAENLHRAELTVLEREEHRAEWMRLSAIKHAEVQSRQVDAFESKRPDGKGHRPAGGRSEAARSIGITEPAARRAEAVASLQPEVKAEAKVLHLDNNQSALLKAASRGPSKEEQLRALREEAARKASRNDDVSASERRIEAAVNAVKKLSDEERAVFADWFDEWREGSGTTVFDKSAFGGGAR